jgi:MFS family permease
VIRLSEHHKKVDLKGISQKVYRHAYIDGFAFILGGFMLYLTAGIINLHPVFISLIIITFIVFIPLSKSLQSRFTYPRLGYFKVKTEDPKKLVPGMLLFSFGIVIAFLILLIIFTGGDPRVLYDFENWYRFIPIVFGIIMFGPSLDLVDKTGQRIYYSIGIFSTILGLFIVWINFQNAKFGFTIYLLLLGSISWIMGFITFVKFIKKYPIIEDSEHLDIQEDNDDS